MIIPNTRSAAWVIPGIVKTRIAGDTPAPTSAYDIIYKACAYFSMSEEALFKKTNKASVVYPRHIVTYLLCTHTKLSLREIADITRAADHTSVMYIRDKIKDLLDLQHEERLKKDIAEVLKAASTVGDVRTSLVGKLVKLRGRHIKILGLTKAGHYRCKEPGQGLVFEISREVYDQLFLPISK